MPFHSFQPMVFVDLETTGSIGGIDRITEVGIVEVDAQGRVSEWSSLVNPQTTIPPFIERLTGITDEMVARAPTFSELAPALLARLQGRLFVAHNARFDHGFLRHEFARLGMELKVPVLCTVKLSRHLYPEHSKHSLDALIERHGLRMQARHRALADAAVLWQFWQVLLERFGPEQLDEAVGTVTGRRHWPAHLDAGLLDELPECQGVYLLHGEGEQALYVGKARNVRQGVLAHFSAARRAAKAQALARDVRRVSWHVCAGELGLALLEASLMARLQPLHNRRARQPEGVFTWQVPAQRAVLRHAGDVDWRGETPSYGLFGSQREAIKTLRDIAEMAQLCLATLGLEETPDGQPCRAVSAQACSGVCHGQESLLDHQARVRKVMQDWRVQPWPHAGAVALREGDVWHVVEDWRYLGTAASREEIEALSQASIAARQPFDKDVYKLLVGALARFSVEVL